MPSNERHGMEISILIQGFIIFCSFIQAFLISSFLMQFFETKHKAKKITLRKIECVAFIFISLQLESVLQIGDVVITIFIFWILFCFSNKYLLGSKIQHGIFIFIELLLIPLININFLQIILLVTDMSVEEYLDINNPYYLAGIVIATIIYYCVSKLFLKFKGDLAIFLNKKYFIIYTLIAIYSLLVESIIFYFLQKNVQINNYHIGLLFISWGAVGIDIYIVFTMCKISRQRNQEERIKMLQFQNKCQEQQLNEIRHSEKRIQRLRHDYGNMLANIEELVRNRNIDECMTYLKKANNYYMRDSHDYICSGNSILDATLNSKLSICNEKGIEVSSCIIGDFSNIDGFMISIILFNLLDNAIEASQKIIKRKIKVELKIKGEYFSCIIKNKIEQSVLQVNHDLKTDKADKKLHGFGIKHVEELVEKSDGLIEYFESAQYFCVHIMLPLERINNNELG